MLLSVTYNILTTLSLQEHWTYKTEKWQLSLMTCTNWTIPNFYKILSELMTIWSGGKLNLSQNFIFVATRSRELLGLSGLSLEVILFLLNFSSILYETNDLFQKINKIISTIPKNSKQLSLLVLKNKNNNYFNN